MSIDDLMRDDNNREMAAGARAGARAAARRLADVYDPRLPAQVEAALHPSIRNRHRPEQYLDLVSLGSLIVSVASTAWMVYQDLRSRQPAPVAQDVVVHRVRIRLDHADPAGQPQLTPAQQTQLLEIVVEEVLRVADTSTDGEPQPDPDLPPQPRQLSNPRRSPRGAGPAGRHGLLMNLATINGAAFDDQPVSVVGDGREYVQPTDEGVMVRPLPRTPSANRA